MGAIPTGELEVAVIKDGVTNDVVAGLFGEKNGTVCEANSPSRPFTEHVK